MRLRVSLPLLVLAACSSPSRVCTPGAQVACACAAGAAGVQVCSSDGQSLGACQCGGVGGGTANGGGAGGGSGTGGSVATGGGGGGSACVPVIGGAAPATADLYLMLDKTGSMSDSLGAGTKWDLVGSGLTAFATAPTSPVKLGIQYFGQPPLGSCPQMCTLDGDCGVCGPCFMGACIGNVADSCTAVDYSTPDVEVSPMPAQEGALADSLSAHSPAGSHATSAALQGLVDHTQSWAASHRDDAVAGVLITGGDPSECDTDPGDLAAIAADSGAPIYVYRLGTVSTADGIAAAGGTTAAVPIANEADLINALSGTASALSHCRYQVDAGLGDGGLVHVRQGGALLSRVSSAAACGASAGWWYGGADVVVLCSASCAVDAGLSAEVGCP